MTETGDWGDWLNALNPNDEAATEESLRNLARYANPATLSQLGVTLGAGRDRSGLLSMATPLEVAIELAIRLRGNKPSYTIEPYRPLGSDGQTIRTASELREGMGTCLDFAVATAAGCVREGIAVHLCVTVGVDGSSHAFLAVPRNRGADQDRGAKEETEPFFTASFQNFIDGAVASGELALLDPTPLPGTPLSVVSGGHTDTRDAVRRATRRLEGALSSGKGFVFSVDVQKAVTESHPFWTPPPRPRALGITSLLPDALEGMRSYESRREVEAELSDATGTVVLVGPSGVGKSTLALIRAHGGVDRAGRGWFLDGSDRAALRLSLARAEAQCRGEELDNIQAEAVSEYVTAARRRLAVTSLPWVVIIDNADGPITSVSDLVPSPGIGQLVIITSTNEEWAADAQALGWSCLDVTPLQRSDLDEGERALGLDDSALLPGILRFGGRLAGRSVRGAPAARNVAGLILAAFGDPDDFAREMRAGGALQETLVAAASMPPEDIRQEWIEPALTERGRAATALDQLAEIGVLEGSRLPRDPRAPASRTLWMHRLIRTAVRNAYVDAHGLTAMVVCDVLAVESDQAPAVVRSLGDLAEQASFLRAAMETPPHSFTRATLTVLNALESRGGRCIADAAALAAAAFDQFPTTSAADRRARAVAALAIARRANQQRDATDDEVEDGIALCEDIVGQLADDETSASRLVVGRAQAMQAILIGKRADRLLARDREQGEALLDENILVLTKSFETRAAALGWVPAEGSTPDEVRAAFLHRVQQLGLEGRSVIVDPERHVDRAWFNLGGAYIKRAPPYVSDPTSPERLERLRTLWSRSLGAYAGSLSLRPGPDLYRAASLNGVAIVAYMMALNGATPLDLSEVPRLDAIGLLWSDQSRSALLRVAEACVAEAHAIRADIAGPFDGDTAKTRDLQTKIACSWKIGTPDEQGIASAFAALSREIYADHGILPA